MLYRVTPILAGARSADQGMMTYQSGYGKKVWLPMWAFLVRGEDVAFLVDTGLEDFVTPPGFTEETGLTPEYLEEALAARGLAPSDIALVINTHLHDDHCANNQLFPDVKHYVQAAEWEFCQNPHPIDGRYDADLLEGLDLVLLEGDHAPLPGVEIIATPGHSPGCQTVRIATADGPVVIAGMCANAKNFPATGAAICPGTHTDSRIAYDSAQRIKAMGGIILPLHEVRLGIRSIP